MFRVIKKTAGSPEGYFAVFLVLYEFIFHIAGFGMTKAYLINKLLFGIIAGVFFGALISLLPAKAGRIASAVLSVFFCLYYLIQLIYGSVFATYWSMSATAGIAGQALDYKTTILRGIVNEAVPFVLLIALLAAGLIYIFKWSSFERHGLPVYILQACALCTAFLYFVILINSQGDDKNSPMEVMRHYSSVELSIQKLGVLETMMRDGIYVFQTKVGDSETSVSDTGFEHEAYVASSEVEISTDTTEELGSMQGASVTEEAGSDTTEEAATETEVKMYSPQVLDLNLSEMDELTNSQAIQNINRYVNSSQPSYTNDYTGMFEGYNLIFIVAEGFDGFVIDKDRTPELYKMSREGFWFKNFYTPLWYGSTLGGEYANLTGNMPKSGGYLSMQKVGAQGNAMPFTLGNQLGKLGYNVYAYHNNGYQYYDRHISRQYIGYQNYIGVGNGMPVEKSASGNALWPQSDQFMEQNTFDLYAGEEPFHVYYLTVSGHLEYNFGGNAMSAKHKDEFSNLTYSETTKAYIACQYELELMVSSLNKDLEAKGLADNTLIVIVGDHVPYDNMEIPDELSGKNLDKTFECYRNTLIIYSASMKKPVIVDKVCYSLDILPTVSNLMGLEFDSRMMIGRDIMSDSPGLAIMSDGSFITDEYRYNAADGSVIMSSTRDISQTEIDNMKSVVSNRFRLADSICETNYYKYVQQLMQGTAEGE